MKLYRQKKNNSEKLYESPLKQKFPKSGLRYSRVHVIDGGGSVLDPQHGVSKKKDVFVSLGLQSEALCMLVNAPPCSHALSTKTKEIPSASFLHHTLLYPCQQEAGLNLISLAMCSCLLAGGTVSTK